MRRGGGITASLRAKPRSARPILDTHPCTSNPQKYSGNDLCKARCRHFGVRGSRLRLASLLRITLVPVKLLLQILLSILGSGESRHGDPEFLAARRASSDCGSAAQPLDHPEIPPRHETVSHIPIFPARCYPSMGTSARHPALEGVLAVPLVSTFCFDGLSCGRSPVWGWLEAPVACMQLTRLVGSRTTGRTAQRILAVAG